MSNVRRGQGVSWGQAGLGPNQHRVSTGETRTKIAAKYKISVEALEDANPHLKTQKWVHPNEILDIPPKPVPPGGLEYWDFKEGDVLFYVAEDLGCTVEELKAANGLGEYDMFKVGDRIYPPGSRHLRNRRESNRYEVNQRAATPRRSGVRRSLEGRRAPRPRQVEILGGDSWEKIADRYGVDVQDLKDANPDTPLASGRWLMEGKMLTLPSTQRRPPVDLGQVEILGGDSWEKIAARYGVDVQDLKDANPNTPLASGRWLMEGKMLTLPGHQRQPAISVRKSTEFADTQEIENDVWNVAREATGDRVSPSENDYANQERAIKAMNDISGVDFHIQPERLDEALVDIESSDGSGYVKLLRAQGEYRHGSSRNVMGKATFFEAGGHMDLGDVEIGVVSRVLNGEYFLQNDVGNTPGSWKYGGGLLFEFAALDVSAKVGGVSAKVGRVGAAIGLTAELSLLEKNREGRKEIRFTVGANGITGGVASPNGHGATVSVGVEVPDWIHELHAIAPELTVPAAVKFLKVCTKRGFGEGHPLTLALHSEQGEQKLRRFLHHSLSR